MIRPIAEVLCGIVVPVYRAATELAGEHLCKLRASQPAAAAITSRGVV